MRPDDIALMQLLWIENRLGVPIGHLVDISRRTPTEAICWLQQRHGSVGNRLHAELGSAWHADSYGYAVSARDDLVGVHEPAHNFTLARSSPVLPAAIQQLADAPLGVRIRGNVALATHPHRVAIVGSRHPRADSSSCARRLAAQLARSGACIVSGLAIGVDTAAHLGALDCGGSTIAVLGSGLDAVHPASNRELAGRIERENGMLISEYPPVVPARPHQFAARNRIIAALADMVIVIQARHKSGSMITARRALETNADIGVIPGWIGDPEFEGSLALIRDGALVVTHADDIRTHIGLPIASGHVVHPIQRHLDAPRSVDELANLTRTSSLEVSRSLIELELAGSITTTADGRWINQI